VLYSHINQAAAAFVGKWETLQAFSKAAFAAVFSTKQLHSP
jgi:hypothetical protein